MLNPNLDFIFRGHMKARASTTPAITASKETIAQPTPGRADRLASVATKPTRSNKHLTDYITQRIYHTIPLGKTRQKIIFGKWMRISRDLKHSIPSVRPIVKTFDTPKIALVRSLA